MLTVYKESRTTGPFLIILKKYGTRIGDVICQNNVLGETRCDSNKTNLIFILKLVLLVF